MMMLALILVAIALADGKGSGPYLPSGWRPDGPAFFLPSEIVKPLPTLTPVIDLSLQGSEASGSDFLQEYGPPKVQEISQNLLNQGLPDVTIEQTFGVAAQNDDSQIAAEKVVEISEVKPEAPSTEIPTTASQSSINDSPPISAELPILDFEIKETTSVPNIEQATVIVSQTNQENTQESNGQSNQLNSQASVNVQSNQQSSQASSQYVSELTNQQNSEVSNVQSNLQNSQESTELNQQESTQSLDYQQESSTASDLEKVTASSDSIGNTEVLLVNVPAVFEQTVPGVQNIPAIIASLENEISTQQSEVNQVVGELTSDQSSEQIPEGFLEYGPPGFAEYGPPKEEEKDKSQKLQTVQANETNRRRRFSPRIRFGKK